MLVFWDDPGERNQTQRVGPTAAVAQLVEPRFCNPVVRRSIRLCGTNNIIMPYSQKIIDAVAKTPKSLGNQLGRWAVYHDFPVTKIAKALGVTRQTVYNWFTGTEVFVGYRNRVEFLLEILRTSSNADEAWRTICFQYNLEP